MNPTPQAFAILGPTASGKTRLALELAQQLPIEIISLDSALVYRDMNIGTAKPTAAELASVPHHLIDIISPLEAYSAAQFVNDCTRLCQEIHQRGKLPIIVGGTMMYYHALTQGLNDLPEANPTLRAQLHADKQQHGIAYLYQRLQHIDPPTAARLQPTDSQRIERALEVFLLTGKPLSAHFNAQTQHAPLNLSTLALIPAERARLHQNIALRFETMLTQGLLDEVKHLQTQYPSLTADSTAMRCVGYRQAWDYLAQRLTHTEFVEQGIIATRQLAKRQLTWLRKLGAQHLIDPYHSPNMLPTALTAIQQHFQL